MSRYTEVKEIYGNRFKVVSPPKKFKYFTAGRFSKAIGVNYWGTPFQAWCEIVKCKVPAFEDNKYTIAGKLIEPKLIDYAREMVSPYIRDPEQYFECEDAKREMNFEFFDDDLFGGMWDALAFDEPNVISSTPVRPIAVIECKTTSRPQDWVNGVPDNYKAQGLLYAELLGVEDVYFPVAFLEPEDYDYPEEFECTDENTRLYHVKRSEEPIGVYDNIKEAMRYARDWWDTFIEDTLTSPEFDEKKDAEYLALIRQCELSELGASQDDQDELELTLAMLKDLDDEIEAIERDNQLDQLKKQRKELNAKIQQFIKPMINEIEGKNSVDAGSYVFTVSSTRKVDYDALKRDGLFEKYVTLDKAIRTKRKEEQNG